MERRILGKEIIEFTDGSKKEVKLHAVPARKVTQLKSLAQKAIWEKDKNGRNKDIKDFYFDESEWVYGVLSQSFNKDDINQDEFDSMETDGTKLFKKYFGNFLSHEKKDNTSDAS